ncbi:hypothetical protein ACRQ1B_24920 [Rhizobium panacihumi]|uniref:hypothetical protein n=1 Tax=Rhizobium panacihumi TaxID=2008450 RepID=UPI003D7B48C2
MTEEQDQFEFWLMDMDDAIENFRRSIPAELASRLDFSDESLKILESFVLEIYPDVETIKQSGEAKMIDGMSRYVGEVFRKHLGGRWFIDYSDKKNAFYGLPQLKNLKGQIVQICPMTLVSASTDRRRGDFIFSVFSNMRNRVNPT